MVIGINNRNEIKKINDVADKTLLFIELDEMAIDYPFKGWSNTKILCYCYKISEQSISVYPYVNTDKIEEIEKETLLLQAQVIELELEKIRGAI